MMQVGISDVVDPGLVGPIVTSATYLRQGKLKLHASVIWKPSLKPNLIAWSNLAGL